MPRIRGRRVYPATLEERRLMHALGCDGSLYVGRGQNPYLVGRRLARAASTPSADILFLRDIAARAAPPRTEPIEAPSTESRSDERSPA